MLGEAMKNPIVLVLSLAFATSPALADVTATREYDFTLAEGGRISLDNVNGDIDIEGVAGDHVHVLAKLKADSQEYLDALNIEVESSDDLVRIETHHPKSGNRWFNNGGDSGGSVSYELKVPSGSRLDSIETVNGDIHITGVKGPVSVETVNGKMILSGLADDAKMDTVNGAIDARFDVLGGAQRVKAETVNGRVVLQLPADTSAEVHAETLNGGIDADDFGLKPDKGFVGRDLDGSIGDGQARLHVDTVNGSVTIRRNK